MSVLILLQHLGGSKANQIEQLPLENLEEITLGRDATCTIAFDPQRDDTVSRRHAVIRAQKADPPTFTITDLGSANGTRVNGSAITGEHELLVGDTVELGAGGPKFVFDLQPRPAGLVGRTRVIDIAPSAPTRVIRTPDETTTTIIPERPTTVGPKRSIGQDTVLHMLSEHRQATENMLQAQRQTTSRTWQYIVAGILAIVFTGGAGLYYVSHRAASSLETAKADIQAGVETTVAGANAGISQRIGMSSTEIAQKAASATVFLKVRWRVYDTDSGKPLFLRVTTRNSVKRPSFVELADHRIVPWLMTEDEGFSNYPIGGRGVASGFVIDQQGYIVTNKHVAAAWMRPFDLSQGSGELDLYQAQASPAKEQIPQTISSNDTRVAKLVHNWVPASGGWVFQTRQPVFASQQMRPFEGKDDTLEVRFPGNRAGTSGRFVRAAPDADVALIKVDTQQTLTWAELSEADEVKIGQRVIVLGYPEFTNQAVAVVNNKEIGQDAFISDLIPDPTVTDGIISHIGQSGSMKSNDPSASNLLVYSYDGDLYQLTVPTGRGNSGGPVFNTSGKVIGIFTYINPGHDTVTFAYPIKYAQMLKNVQ